MVHLHRRLYILIKLYAHAYVCFVLCTSCLRLYLLLSSYKTIMGEYIIYYRQKIIGGIYDDRLLVKPVAAALLMPDAVYQLPYEGAKEMLLVNEVDSREFLIQLFNAMYDELPAPKKRK